MLWWPEHHPFSTPNPHVTAVLASMTRGLKPVSSTSKQQQATVNRWISTWIMPKTRVLGTINRRYDRRLCQNLTTLAPKFRRYGRGLCPKPVFWAPKIADKIEDCAKSPPFLPLLRHQKSQLLSKIVSKPHHFERPEKILRSVLNHSSVYIQFPFTCSEIELSYLKDPEGFSHAVSLSLSLFSHIPSAPFASRRQE